MNKQHIKELALQLMSENKSGINLIDRGWTFKFSKSKGFIGRCSYIDNVIELSDYYLPLMEEDEVIDTILHEVAHALTQGDGHGKLWKAMAKKLGAQPKAKTMLKNQYKLEKYKYAVVYDNPITGEVEFIGGINRKPLDTKSLYAKGRKSETMGKLRVITQSEYVQIKEKVNAVKPQLEQPKDTMSLGIWMRTVIKDIVTSPMTVDEIFKSLMESYSSEIEKRIPTGKNLSTYTRSKIVDSCGREKGIKEGSGRTATWKFI